mgnify:CR=1 FL=1
MNRNLGHGSLYSATSRLARFLAPDSSTTGLAPRTRGQFPSVEIKAVDFLGTSRLDFPFMVGLEGIEPPSRS